MTLEELQVLITANTTELKNELKESKKELASLEKEVKKKTNNIAGFFKKMIPIGVLAIGFKKLTSSSEQAYKSQIQNETRLLAVMQKRGEATKQDIQDILNLTAAEQNLGVVSDDVQLAGAQELSTYIDKASSIKKLLPQLNNMIAQQYGYNATQEEAINIATMMGKVLEGQTGALSRYGYYFDENQEKILKFGTEEEKVATLTGIIHDSIGDVNEALGNTAVGKQIQLANAWSDVKEQLGYVIVQVKQVLVPVFQVLVTWLGTAVSYLRQFLQVLGFTASKQNGVNKAIIGGASAETEYGDAVEDSTKKQNKQLASFDEMNVLKEDNSSDDSGSTGNSSGIGGLNNIDFNIGIDGDVEVSDKVEKLATFIKNAFSSVKDTLKQVWDSKPVQSYVNLLKTEFNFAKDLAVQLGTDLWTNMTTTWSNIKDNVGNTFDNIGSLFSDMWDTMSAKIEEKGPILISNISSIFNSIWKDAIDPAVQHITKVWSDFTDILLDLWNEHGKSLIDNIGEFVENATAWFQKIWDNVLEPIITPFLETLSWLWDKHLKGLIEEVGNFIAKLVNGALEIYNKFIYPIITQLSDRLAPAWATVSNLIIGVLGTIIAFVSDTFKKFFKICGGLIDFITGIFTGNWKKAWQGVKDIFKASIEGVVAIIKLPINLIIDGINSFIAGLNKVKIPDWVPGVGGKGFHIAKIPKLAQGGVIDKPTLAEIGESGREVVMPLENNTGWISELAEEINERNNGIPTHITFKIGEDTVVDKFIDDIRKKGFETNGEVVLNL